MLASVLVSTMAESIQAQSFTEIDQAAKQGIQAGVYPGAVVVIGRSDSIIYARGYGHFTWSPKIASPVSGLHPLGHRVDFQGDGHRQCCHAAG